MRIEEHISELLFEHDCVIVPDFGGFIGNYSPAKVDEVKHLFEPPRKKILFNKGLTQNDGLLANHMSIREQLTYAEALKQIAGEVGRYRNELKDNKRIVFENIGVLYMDESNNVAFQPDEKVNYLPEAFGLSAFYRLPVEQEKAEEKESTVVQLHKERSRLRPYAIAAAISALVTSTFWFTINETNLSNYSSLNIFGKKEAPTYVYSPDHSLAKLNAPIAKDSLTIYVKEAPAVKSIDIVSSSYHIVAGCFRVYENAQNMIAILKKKNVEATIVGKTPEGLYIVGCGKYNSYNEAESQLDSFRKNVQEEAWVFGKSK
ncbi:MAG TPA: hypothetical protein VK783_10640 [Bacteroidia bacterium]|nr:hypothetical protein [Bacteroidia bacterium]